MESPIEKMIIENIFVTHISQINKEQKLIWRIPIKIYKTTHELLKKQLIANSILLDIFLEKMYIPDPLPCNNQSQPPEGSFHKLIRLYADDQKILMTQIALRLIMLALAVKVNKVQEFKEQVNCNFVSLVKALQLEMVLSVSPSFSEFLSKELQFLFRQFENLQYFEETKKLFEELQLNSVDKSIQTSIKTIKQKFKSIVAENISALKQNNQNGKSMKKRVTIHIPQKKSSQQQATKKNLQQKTPIREQTNSKVQSSKKQLQGQSASVIAMANKMRRQSFSVKQSSFNPKYTFKSNKKQIQQIQQILQYSQAQTVLESPVKRFVVPTRNRATIIFKQHMDEDSRVLCHATPVKTNKKKEG